MSTPLYLESLSQILTIGPSPEMPFEIKKLLNKGKKLFCNYCASRTYYPAYVHISLQLVGLSRSHIGPGFSVHRKSERRQGQRCCFVRAPGAGLLTKLTHFQSYRRFPGNHGKATSEHFIEYNAPDGD